MGDDFFVIIRWLVAGLILALITNLMVTLLIAGRLWSVGRSIPGFMGTPQNMKPAWIILEAGAIYSITNALLVIFATLKTEVGGFISNVFVQICVRFSFCVMTHAHFLL
jgi:ABC-type multidrug transport system permease subunit